MPSNIRLAPSGDQTGLVPGVPAATRTIVPSSCLTAISAAGPKLVVTNAILPSPGANTPLRPEVAVSRANPVALALITHTSVPQSNRMRVLSDDHSISPIPPSPDVRRTLLDPSGLILYRSDTPAISRASAIVRPSGDHANRPLNPIAVVRRTSPVPSVFTRYSSCVPVRSLTKAIDDPSGDQAGDQSNPWPPVRL